MGYSVFYAVFFCCILQKSYTYYSHCVCMLYAIPDRSHPLASHTVYASLYAKMALYYAHGTFYR